MEAEGASPAPYRRAALINSRCLPSKDSTRRAPTENLTPGRRGSFIDLKTIAAALFSRSFSLASLAAFLETPPQKRSTDEHGGELSPAYVDYALDDVQVTWECYRALVAKLRGHQLTKTRPARSCPRPASARPF